MAQYAILLYAPAQDLDPLLRYCIVRVSSLENVHPRSALSASAGLRDERHPGNMSEPPLKTMERRGVRFDTYDALMDIEEDPSLRA